MDISTIISTDFELYDPDTPVSKLVGTFDDPDVQGIVVHGDSLEGVVTRRQLATSHHQPNEKIGTLVWHVPHLRPDEEVEDVANLMLESDAHILPVVDNGDLVGVVTARDILRAVRDAFEVATVRQIYSDELVTMKPTATFGQVVPLFREHRIAHIPVVENGTAVGILSLYDLVEMRIRAMTRSQGGDAGGTDPFGGTISSEAGRTRRGGYGSREGELGRILELPVRDIMVSPVATIDEEAPLDEAVDTMFEVGGSSLVVTVDGKPAGILTTSDLLDALRRGVEATRAVQLYGVDLLDDMTYTEIVDLIDRFDKRDSDMTVLDAKIHLHQHDETYRGMSLILCRMRLHTDRGLFIAAGEGYGAKHAITEARHMIERQLMDHKDYGKSKKAMDDEERWEKRFGWWLEA